MSKDKIRQMIFKILFYPWFIFSLILIVFSDKGYLTILLMGQYFLVITIIIFIESIRRKIEVKKLIIEINVILVAIIYIIASILGLLNISVYNGLNPLELMILITMLLFIIFGIELIVFGIINYNIKKIKETVKVEGSIDYEFDSSGTGLVVINYVYDNQEYSALVELESLKEIGINKFEIEIDPDNPSSVLSNTKNNINIKMIYKGKEIETAHNNNDNKNNLIGLLIAGIYGIILIAVCSYLYIKYTLTLS